jgi:transcriptional regulator with XRE-family HTH domain
VPKKEETFADRLQALRKRAGVTQYRLAQLSGVSKQTLSRLELGTAQPSWDTVQALARGLGIEVGAFVIESAAPAVVEPARPRGRPRKSE